MTMLTSSKSRQMELEEQGHVKRFFRNISGKNGVLSRAISGDVVTAQLAAQKMIQHLAERQVLTLDIICAMHQKMNALQLENDRNFMQLSSLIELIYNNTDQYMQHLLERIIKVETNVNVINWYLTKEQKNYHKLNLPSLVLTIVKDFYILTDGHWTDQYTVYIEKVLTDLQISQSLSYHDIAYQQDLLHQVFQLVNPVPERDLIYLTDGMHALYIGQDVMSNHTYAARDMIYEMLNTLILIDMLTRPTKTQYQVVLHQLESPDKRIHVIRTLHQEAGIPKDTSRDLTWSTQPSVVKVYELEDEAHALKKALEQYKCSVSIEEIVLTS
ncbi:hypothetical protein HGO21_03530 [Acinetobacter sp. CUI P1]|nr:hypothetical protein [Acinetobacter sp. CUI P1]